ncbi:MAG: immune inhibitor A [Bacteroidales bacterium]|nr:immune inhibitor A [Bacteroidales bacterium]
MKTKLLTILLVLASLLIHAQSVRYSRIEVPLHALSPETIARLGLPFDFVQDSNFIWMELPDEEIAGITAAGVQYRVLIDDLETFYKQRNEGVDYRKVLEEQRRSGRYTVPANFSLGSMGGFCTYNEMLGHLANMHQLYPDLISVKDSVPGGQSVEGRPIYWYRISNDPGVTQSKPRVLYTALTHGREPGSMQQMLYFMYYLLENYANDDEINSLVDHTELYFIPCVNPDAYIYNQATNPSGGGLWRKNRRDNGNGSMGVDLNRNFGYMWGFNDFGSSPNPSSLTYRGTAPFSEPETQLIKSFCESYNFSIALNYHSYGNYLLQPWGYVSYLLSPDHDLFQEYGNLMTRENNYRYGVPGALLYVVNGDANDWLYGEQTTKSLCYSFTPEVGSGSDGFWPPVQRIIPLCEENLYQNIMAAKLAGFYATFYDLTPINLSKQRGWISFGIKRLGLSELPFTVTIEPVTDAFISIENSTFSASGNLLEVYKDSVEYILKPTVRPGDEIKLAITVSSDGFIFTDTIVKIFGSGQQLFFDDCSTMNNWESTKWNTSTSRSFSPTRSIGNAPSTFYSNNDSSLIILAQAIDLSDAQCAWLSFYASWDLNGGKDYVRLMASDDNGQTWNPLKGRLMENHFVIDDPETYVYRGESNEWLKDWISLTNYCGGNLMLGFFFTSDATVGRAGFYFDDFKIEVLDPQHTVKEINLTKGWNSISDLVVPQNDSLNYIFQNYTADLMILENLSGFYQPGNQQSGLIRWDETSGYFLKASDDFTLMLAGNKQTATILELNAGWNLIPVLSEYPFPISALTTIPSNTIEIIREASGINVFWPDQNIQTLDFLMPKGAYLVKLKQPALLIFGEN